MSRKLFALAGPSHDGEHHRQWPPATHRLPSVATATLQADKPSHSQGQVTAGNGAPGFSEYSRS